MTDSQLLESGVVGTWSVRDIIAHVTTWEEEALKHLPLIISGGRPPRYSLMYGGIDAFNARTMEQKKTLTLRDVMNQQAGTHHQVIELIANVSEEQLVSGARFRRRLRLDTYGHYPKHAEAIRRWRGRKSVTNLLNR